MNILLVFVFALTAVGARGSRNPSNIQYMVKLEVSKAGQCSVCSGSFIDTNWILTAAHCVHGMDSVIAYIGPPFEGNCSTGYKINKDSIIIHESFQEVANFVYRYDVALIKFTQKTSCAPVKTVRFLNEKPHTKFYRTELVAFVRFSSSCGQSPASMSVRAVVSDLRCPFGVNLGEFNESTEEKILCVSAFDYNGSCDGDTSTHLFTPNILGELIGIMTNPRDENCGRNNTTASEIVFTHVYQYKSWIINQMSKVGFSSTRAMVRLNIIKEGQCWVCSGSFVNPNWILTSAHCVADASSVVVDVGKHFNSSCPMSYAINKSEIMIHPSFSREYNIFCMLIKQSHDIALIKFTKKNSCRQYWVVRLPGENVQRESYYEAWSQFTRFGEFCSTPPQALSTKNLRVVNDDRCKPRAVLPAGGLGGGEIAPKPMDEDQMCISTGLNDEICFGDSSGHLFRGGTAELIGIMSRQPNQPCSIVDQVTFTRISYYVRWIKSHWSEIEQH